MKVGVLGGGQLGRMMALAGYPLGLRFRFFDPSPDAAAGHMAEFVSGSYDDLDAVERFAAGLDAITYEFENVPAETARYLAERLPVHPTPAALEVAQDRLIEKTFFRKLGFQTPAFAPVDSRNDLDAALREIGLPAVLKTRRDGYDGKGQAVLQHVAEIDTAWEQLGGRPLILEAFVPFERELSIVAARGLDGSFRAYPLVENEHRAGILGRTIAPAPGLTPELQSTAEACVSAAMMELGYAGVMTIEFFEHQGRLLVNEMAPRVHNSGHWTIEGAETSQFENHLRAVLGLPLGSTAVRGYSTMLNLIGATPEWSTMLGIDGLHLHLYGKDPRPGRKLGHVTICATDPTALEERLKAFVESLHRS
ncbi:MAG: 5-(carboxyamino)imidazole ribonucleotide synthase [Chloroflexia bacterium]|nr:5-(carboxyamino)imidazole ribonucleotide synthase [Chloroflexia bacterium]